MNLPLQMRAVFRGRPSPPSMTRGRFASGQVLPATNYCGALNKTCRCAANYQSYKCVGPNDDCTDCGASGNQT
jgi:hypothetical protein